MDQNYKLNKIGDLKLHLSVKSNYVYQNFRFCDNNKIGNGLEYQNQTSPSLHDSINQYHSIFIIQGTHVPFVS